VTALRHTKWVTLAVALVLLGALPYVADTFYVNIATQALYLGLFALSINLIAGYGGMVTLGQAGISGIAGYTLGIALTNFDLPLAAAVLVALAATVVCSAFFGLLAVRTSGVYFLMITLAEGMIVWGIAQRWTTVTGGDNGLTGIVRPSFALQYWTFYYLTLGVVALCTAVIAVLVRSPFGLALKGIREAEGRMAPLGYHVTVHKLVAFTIAGFFAGISGLLLAMYNNFFSPAAVHLKASADGLLMSILGGMATLTGAFVGSSIFVLITNYVSGFVERWPTLLGLIFIGTILFARDGLVGAWNRLVWLPALRRREPSGTAGEAAEEKGPARERGAEPAGGRGVDAPPPPRPADADAVSRE
jgi:branched-chain amino acid transport system permease protein